jgi:hypothetical protein
MGAENKRHLWVRIRFPSREALTNTRDINGVELFPATMRVIDEHNLLIDGFLPAKIYASLKEQYHLRILGDVRQEIEKASSYVSRTNRYRKD